METVILVIEAIVLVGVNGYLTGSMVRHIRIEKRQAKSQVHLRQLG